MRVQNWQTNQRSVAKEIQVDDFKAQMSRTVLFKHIRANCRTKELEHFRTKQALPESVKCE